MWVKYDFRKYNIWKYYCLNLDGTKKTEAAVSIRKYNIDDCYSAHIYCIKYSFLAKACYYDRDLDILKLKCLLVAKDVGWNIEGLI